MKLTQDQENAKALAAFLGIEEDEAARRLQLRIAVTFDSDIAVCRDLGEYVIAMLSRTIQYAGVRDSGSFSAEIVIGPEMPVTSAPIKVFAGQEGPDFVIRRGAPTKDRFPETHRALLVLAACYVASSAVQ